MRNTVRFLRTADCVGAVDRFVVDAGAVLANFDREIKKRRSREQKASFSAIRAQVVRETRDTIEVYSNVFRLTSSLTAELAKIVTIYFFRFYIWKYAMGFVYRIPCSEWRNIRFGVMNITPILWSSDEPHNIM